MVRFSKWRCHYLTEGRDTKTRRGRPVDNQPSPTSCTTLHHMTCDTWHLTPDMWRVTWDTWWGVNILSKFQLPNSYGLVLTVSWRFWTKGSLNELMSDGGDCRTAPATLGLLNIESALPGEQFVDQWPDQWQRLYRHSPNLPYFEGIDSHAGAIPLLKVM